MPDVIDYDAGSFRDRDGRVYRVGDKIRRGLSEHGLKDWTRFSESPLYRRLSEEGLIPKTTPVDPPAGSSWVAALEHETIPVITYPYEWSFGMLRDAAIFHLDLIAEAIRSGLAVKDATPYNIAWLPTGPIFMDLASFTEAKPDDPWPAYDQFCRLFLYPLMLHAYLGLAHQPLLRGDLEGVSSDFARRLLVPRKLLRPGVMKHVYMQAVLRTQLATAEGSVRRELQEAGFTQELVLRNIAGLRCVINGLKWRKPQSMWTDYVSCTHYSEIDTARKKDFVAAVAAAHHWKQVCDFGSNTGTYARIAAAHADLVLAMDSDPAAVETLYRDEKGAADRKILPLVLNVADPSPGLGWNGRERRPYRERVSPDLILCLALIHHVVLTAGVRLAEFVEWLASFNAELVIEFVDRADPMVKMLLRNKVDHYDDYDLKQFEVVLHSRFDVVKREVLPSGSRTLYHARPKGPGASA